MGRMFYSELCIIDLCTSPVNNVTNPKMLKESTWINRLVDRRLPVLDHLNKHAFYTIYLI